ncbi:MAG: hypothetical protein ACI8UO_002183 [Verrucomicrobiales bacterium]|jgi:uncharacterized protein involved in exopolysaccharide biosynthesis
MKNERVRAEHEFVSGAGELIRKIRILSSCCAEFIAKPTEFIENGLPIRGRRSVDKIHEFVLREDLIFLLVLELSEPRRPFRLLAIVKPARPGNLRIIQRLREFFDPIRLRLAVRVRKKQDLPARLFRAQIPSSCWPATFAFNQFHRKIANDRNRLVGRFIVNHDDFVQLGTNALRRQSLKAGADYVFTISDWDDDRKPGRKFVHAANHHSGGSGDTRCQATCKIALLREDRRRHLLFKSPKGDLNQPTMNLSELIQICWAKRVQILIVTAIGGVLTFIIGTQLVSYEASATLHIRPLGEVSETNLGTANVGLTYSPQMDKLATHGRTYMKLIKSRRIMEEVVERLELAKLYEGGGGFADKVKQPLRFLFYGRVPATEWTPTDLAIYEVTRRTQVNLITLSNMIEITYRDKNADRATRIVNEITEVFKAYSQERSSHSAHETGEHLIAQIEAIRGELKLWRERLNKANESHGFHIYSDAELERERQRLLISLSVLRDRLEENNHVQAMNDAKLSKLDAQLAEFPEELKVATTVTANPAIQKLKESLILAEATLQTQIIDFLEGSSQVKAAQAQVDIIKKTIEEEAATILSQETVQLDPVRQALLQAYVTLQVDTEALPMAGESLAARLEALGKTTERFEEAITEIGQITRTIGSLLATESRMISLVEVAKAVEAAALNEVEVIDAARIPRYPNLKNAPLAAYVVLGAIAAFVLAAGSVVWRSQKKPATAPAAAEEKPKTKSPTKRASRKSASRSNPDGTRIR